MVKDPKAAAAEKSRRYYEKNKAKILQAKRLKRLENYQKHAARDMAQNRKKGHKPRTIGPAAVPSLILPPSRKWTLFEGRVYFHSIKGFTLQEVEEIVRVIRQHKDTLLQVPADPEPAPTSKRKRVPRNG